MCFRLGQLLSIAESQTIFFFFFLFYFFFSFSGGIFSSDSRPNFCVCSSLWPLYTLCKVTRRSLEKKKKKRGDWFGFYSNFLMSSYSLCSAAGEKTPAPLSSSFALPGVRNQLECKVVFIKERCGFSVHYFIFPSRSLCQ